MTGHFKLLFDNNEKSIKKREIDTTINKISIEKYPSPQYNFKNFKLKLGVNCTNYISDTSSVYMEVINIQKDFYEIKIDILENNEYIMTTFLMDGKNYILYTRNRGFLEIFFSSENKLENISRNRNNTCFCISDKKDYLYVDFIDNPKKCELKDLDETMRLIEKIAIFCNFSKIKIFDSSYILCNNKQLSLPIYRLLCGREPSIYYKYGFRYTKRNLNSEDFEILSEFNLEEFFQNLQLIIYREKTQKLIFRDRNYLEIEKNYILKKTNVLNFLKTQKLIPKDLFSERLNQNNCHHVLDIINIIDSFGTYNIYDEKGKKIVSICENIKNILDKFHNSSEEQIKILPKYNSPKKTLKRSMYDSP